MLFALTQNECPQGRWRACSWCCVASWRPSSGWPPTFCPWHVTSWAPPWSRRPTRRTWCVPGHRRHYRTPRCRPLYCPAAHCEQSHGVRHTHSKHWANDTQRSASHLNTVMNCLVSSCGLSAFTSATLPSSPSMLRCSSCLSGNSCERADIKQMREQQRFCWQSVIIQAAFGTAVYNISTETVMNGPSDNPGRDSCRYTPGTSDSYQESRLWCSRARSTRTPSPDHTEHTHTHQC